MKGHWSNMAGSFVFRGDVTRIYSGFKVAIPKFGALWCFILTPM